MSESEQLEDLLEAAAPASAAEEEFQFATLPPEISFQTVKVPPPAWLYVGPDDRLIIQVSNAAPNAVIYMSVRLMLPHGEVIPNYYQFTLPAAPGEAMWTIPLPESFLLSVTFVSSSTVRSGACWLRCILMHGSGGGASHAQGIAAGYLAYRSFLTWPYPRFQNPVEGPGRLRVIVGTDPAAGWQIMETVPAGARWRLLALTATLATSAVVIDRMVMLRLDDGVQTWWMSVPSFLHPAGFIAPYNFAIGVPARVSAPPGYIQDALPDRITLAAGWRFRTDTVNMDAGDNWGAPVYYVEEWVEP